MKLRRLKCLTNGYLGYAQFRPYLDDLDGIKVEQRDGQSYARLDR